jgi:hypothetical protein
MDKQEIQNKIDELEKKVTGDMFKDMDLKNKIHVLEMELKDVKPDDSHFECIGCGS